MNLNVNKKSLIEEAFEAGGFLTGGDSEIARKIEKANILHYVEDLHNRLIGIAAELDSFRGVLERTVLVGKTASVLECGSNENESGVNGKTAAGEDKLDLGFLSRPLSTVLPVPDNERSSIESDVKEGERR